MMRTPNRIFSSVPWFLMVLPLGLACQNEPQEVSKLQPQTEAVPYAPANTPSELGLAGYAKVLCSAVFVSGRDPEEAARNSGYFLMPEQDRDAVTDRVIDYEEKAVHLTLRDTITRTAKFYGDQDGTNRSMEGYSG